MDKIFRNEHGLPFLEVDGEPRFLGCLPPDPLFSALPQFNENFTVLDQSQWVPNSLKGLNPPQRNQGQYGSCTGQSTCNAFTVAKLKAAPTNTFPMLSACYIYGNINGGADQGGRVSDAMMAIRDIGTCYNSEVPDNMIFKSQFPSSASQTALRFKALEIYKLNSFEELCSALSLGIPCVSGIAVGRNFTRNQLDSNGLAPLPDVIVGGHALCHTGLTQLNGMWVVETFNSWGSSWGLNGYCFLQKGHWNPGYGFPFDSFAIYSVIDDPQDKNDVPPQPVAAVEEESEVKIATKRGRSKKDE